MSEPAVQYRDEYGKVIPVPINLGITPLPRKAASRWRREYAASARLRYADAVKRAKAERDKDLDFAKHATVYPGGMALRTSISPDHSI